MRFFIFMTCWKKRPFHRWMSSKLLFSGILSPKIFEKNFQFNESFSKILGSFQEKIFLDSQSLHERFAVLKIIRKNIKRLKYEKIDS